MNKTISLIRIAILFALGMLALLFLQAEEQDGNLLICTFRFICDKALAVGTIFLMGRLYRRWSRVDPWLKACDKMCDEVMDKPNPSQL